MSSIKKMYHVFRGEPTSEPMDVMSESQLYAWLQCGEGLSAQEASDKIADVDSKGEVEI